MFCCSYTSPCALCPCMKLDRICIADSSSQTFWSGKFPGCFHHMWCRRFLKPGKSGVWDVVFLQIQPILTSGGFWRSRFFPKQCGNTWGSYGNGKRPGCLDRGAGEVLDGIHRYFRGFVLACSFRLWIFVVFGWLRPAPEAFVCKFS